MRVFEVADISPDTGVHFPAGRYRLQISDEHMSCMTFQVKLPASLHARPSCTTQKSATTGTGVAPPSKDAI